MRRTALVAGALTGLVLLAIGLRLAALGLLKSAPTAQSEERSIARHLATGQGYSFLAFSYLGPTSSRPPVYPLVVSGGYALLGIGASADRAAVLLNIGAAGLSVLAAYALGRRLLWHSCAAMVFAGLIAVMPSQLYASLYLQGLSVALLLTLTALWLATGRDLRLALPAGLCAGLAVLTESVLVLPLAGVIMLIAARRPAFGLLMLAGTLTLVTPWVYRNSLVQHQFTGITNELWPDLFLGNGPDATGSVHLRLKDFHGKPLSRFDQLSPPQADALKRQSESGRNALFRAWTTEWIHANPLAYARLCVIRAAKTLWLDWNHPMAFQAVNVISRSLGLLGLVAALLLWRRIPSASAAGATGGIERKAPLLSPLALVLVLALGLVLASAFTVAEARNSIFVDLPQLLAIALLADRKCG